MRRVAILTVCAAAVLAAGVAAAGNDVLFTITDPKGDDWGDGTLAYPMRDDLKPGDLDLLTFAARREKDGTVFEATFARPVRKPERRPIDEIGTALDSVARFGFYTFNIDVYIDTDRIPGSGSTTLLPGRRATLAPEFAWDRAVCLTPRPFDAADQLRSILVAEARREWKRTQGRLESEDARRMREQAAVDVASNVFFPTLVWVSGQRIRFFVPDSFLGGAPKPGWAYLVVVTGADITRKLDLTTVVGESRIEPRLMLLPALPGRTAESFGGAQDDDDLQPPIIDLVVPVGEQQEKVLRDYDIRSGRPVVLRGVVPVN